jgi:antitoxin FitA
MPTLNVRNVPVSLHRNLRRLAKDGRRSLNAEILTILDDAVQSKKFRREQAEILRGIRRRRLAHGSEGPGAVELIREDRER